MSDSTEDDQQPTEPTEPTAGRRPTPSAQAASRARRIGGRPMPGPRPDSPVDQPDGAGSEKAPKSTAPKGTAPKSTAPKTKAPKSNAPKRTGPASAQRVLGRAALALMLVSAVAIVALLGVGVWLSHGVWWSKSGTDALRNSERQQVLAAAKTCTAQILSYDYRKLPAAEAAGQACSTGQLKSDYTKLMDTTVKQIAPQNNVVQVFQVEKAGISSVSADGKQWVIVVYGQQQVTSKTVTAGPRLDISNAVVTLNRVGKQWLVSNMTTTS